MSEVTAAERKRLEAIARANEVFDAVSRIAKLDAFIEISANNHDDESGDNQNRRDCKAFWQRIRDLGLSEAHPCLKS